MTSLCWAPRATLLPMQRSSMAERRRAGKALRERVGRAEHAAWTASGERRDPIDVLAHCTRGRLAELVPIRYGRLLRSPFTFLRGSPGLMAYDLHGTPATGIRVQACGDCHLTNFGLFATPERNLIFDVNDFDETLPGPWEWDVKRLVTSFVVAGRANGIADDRARAIAIACARSYRERMAALAEASPLEVWYDRISADDLIENAPDARTRQERERMAEKARGRIGENLFFKITEEADGGHRFVERPPLVSRVTDERELAQAREGIEQYRASLPDDRRVLFDRYWIEDLALRVVGIGSVATRCYVGLFFCDDKNPLLLQVKEARRSVLEPYVGECAFENQGQRVVAGQRLMQSASDLFLGWFRAPGGTDFYVRQLRDMKYSPPIESFSALELERYAELCGRTLARAHAKSGDAATISGYLGRGDKFDTAVGTFAVAYADQIERDHAALVEAARTGRVEASDEETEVLRAKD